MAEEIRPEHKPYIETIRRLWEEAGGQCLYDAERFGLNTHERGVTEPGTVELLFDYGMPVRMFVTEGSYVPLGGSVGGADREEFWRLLNEAYTVHVVRPQRDDSKLRKSSFEYQCQRSGPLVALLPKK